MKRKITFLIAAAVMLLTLLVSPMAMRGQSDYSTDYEGNIELSTTGGSNASTCTVNIADNSYAGIKAGTSSKVGAVMITVPSGTKYLHMHVAAWNGTSVSLAVTPEGYSDNIALTANVGISGNSPFTFDGDPSTSDYYKVVTFSDALTDDTELTFTAVGGKRFVIWGVTSEEEGGTSNPSITTSNVEIAYNATSGSIDYTINNPVTGGSISTTTAADWLTLGTAGNTSVSFTCSANQAVTARTATVTLTYTYNNNQTVTKNVLVSQAGNPNVVNNISDITAAGTYTVQGTIVAKSSRGFIVGDATGYVYYYNANYSQDDYDIGDIVKLEGAVVVYGGVFEFNNTTTITTATSSSYVAEDPTVLTGEDMDDRVASTTPPQLSNYVQYEGTLTVTTSGNNTHYNITDIVGATTAIGSISYPLNVDEVTALDGKHVKVTGYYVGISTTTYYNTMLGSIEEVTTSDPSIEADNVDIAYDATSGAITYTIENQVAGGVLSAATTAEWLTIGTVGNTVPFTCTANTSAASRTATVTLTYTYDNDLFVTKNVTVTQAGNPGTINTISEITAAGTYIVQGTIVAINNRGFILGDGTGYVYYYYGTTGFEPGDYNIGDMVKLDGAVVVYGGVFEFNSTTTITTATSSGYVTEDPTVLTGADMDARVASTTPAQLSDYVQYEGTLTVSGNYYNITNIEGASTAKGSISFPLNTDFASLSGKQVKVTGYYVGVSSSQYYNTMIGTVEEVLNTDPVINANDIEIAYDATQGEIAYTIDNPVSGVSLTAATEVDWISNIVVGTETVTFTSTVNDGDADRNAIITLSYEGADDVEVIVTQKHYFKPATYTLATTIESGKKYIIVGSYTSDEETSYYAMGHQKTSNRAGVAISVDGTTATVETEDVYEIVITALDTEGFYSFYDARTPGYLYAASSSANQLKTETELDENHNGEWEITIDTVFHIVASNSENRNVMQFNYNNGNPLFNCYSDATQLPVYLYVREETTTTQTIALEGGNVKWVSFNVDITLDNLKASIEEALSSTDEAIIKSKNQTLTYKRGRWSGQLTELNLAQMYLIKVSSSCEIAVTGMPIDATTLTATLTPGVNYIAYPYNTSIATADLFDGFVIDNDAVKSKNQTYTYKRGRWSGQLTTLEPGNGYIYNSAGTSDRTFVYPTLEKAGK